MAMAGRHWPLAYRLVRSGGQLDGASLAHDERDATQGVGIGEGITTDGDEARCGSGRDVAKVRPLQQSGRVPGALRSARNGLKPFATRVGNSCQFSWCGSIPASLPKAIWTGWEDSSVKVSRTRSDRCRNVSRTLGGRPDQKASSSRREVK